MAANGTAAKHRPELQRGNSSAAKGCICFHLCTDSEILDFHARLPVVRSAQSPWHKYLAEVYGGASGVRYPIDLSAFEARHCRTA